MTLNPGQQLKGGRYTIEKKLGEGGFGITYLAKDQKGNLVVIKTLKDIDNNDPEFDKRLEDFVNEAIKLRGCQHPHIVKVYQLIKEGDLWGIVMEYIEGESLASLGKLPEAEALLYIHQIGEALTVVHNNAEYRLLHRDVKPGNIMVRTGKSEAVLIDFGIAREFNPGVTQTHTTHKTPFYAPPEQYNNRTKRGAYTDVYSLAATLYKLLTGKEPEAAPSRMCGCALVPPKDINTNISDMVNQAILKGLELNSEDRPQSMEDWLALLPTIQEIPSTVNPSSQTGGSIPDDLNSEVGIDYIYLRDLLAAGEWEEADEETGRLMLKAVDKEYGELSKDEIENFPCKDLRTIDRLWLKYSNGRFGFSVQKRIFDETGKNYVILGKNVGWRENGRWILDIELCYKSNAPYGHLPIIFGTKVWVKVDGGYGREERRFLFSRMEKCGL